MIKRLLILIVIAIFICYGFSFSSADDEPKYLNSEVPLNARVDDLLQRMTLEEKVGQLDMFLGVQAMSKSKEDKQITNVKNIIDVTSVYPDFTIDSLERRIKEGKIGSFLSLRGPHEANYLQSLADSTRLRIPLLNCIDAIHGNGLDAGGATIFPTPLGMASSFDTNLVREIGQITAIEMTASGYHLTHAPNVEIVRDARWGRTGETFGEDPLLVSMMGASMIKGLQGNKLSEPFSVAACAKHFIAGGVTVNGLNATPHNISEREMREIFLPPFLAAINADVASIMIAHHEMNGVPCHANDELINEALKNELGYKGVIISDWMDIEQIHHMHKVARDLDEAYRLALEAGLEIHMHGPGFYNSVLMAVKNGIIDEEIIDKAARNILELKFALGLFENRYTDTTLRKKHILTIDHKAKALEASRKSVVLLKNDDLLPLSKDIKSLFITGPCADDQVILGDWVYEQPEENVITIVEGLKNHLPPTCKIEYFNTGHIRWINDEIIQEASKAATGHEYAIIAVGSDALRFRWSEKTSGENVGITSLELQGKQEELIRSLHEMGIKVVVVLINSSPISPTWTIDNIPAIIEAWEPGMMGGQALAEIIFGDYNPSGRLPISIPRSVGHVKQYYNHKPSYEGRGIYDYGEKGAVFPFGFGLSYTRFDYKIIAPPKKSISDTLKLEVEVSNTGKLKGDDIVLVYMNDIYSSITTPVKKLVAFKRVTLDKGEKKIVEFNISPDQFGFLDKQFNNLIEPGDFEIMVGDKKHLLTITETK